MRARAPRPIEANGAQVHHAGVVLAALVFIGCGTEPEPPPQFPFTFTTHSDGEPLAGVEIRVNDRPQGPTDESGTLRRILTGPPGSPVFVRAVCPEGYRSETEPQQHTLRVVQSLDPAAAARGIQVSFDCPPEHRDAVVVVRAGEFADLPVLIDGREVTRTDASGTAHVHVRMAPRTTFQVRIATLSHERLRPRDPTRSYTIPDQDAFFTFDQGFELEAPPRRRSRRRRPTPEPSGTRLPIRIGR